MITLFNWMSTKLNRNVPELIAVQWSWSVAVQWSWSVCSTGLGQNLAAYWYFCCASNACADVKPTFFRSEVKKIIQYMSSCTIRALSSHSYNHTCRNKNLLRFKIRVNNSVCQCFVLFLCVCVCVCLCV